MFAASASRALACFFDWFAAPGDIEVQSPGTLLLSQPRLSHNPGTEGARRMRKAVGATSSSTQEEASMSRNKLLFVAVLAASVYTWPGVAAADLAAGLSAYRSGDYATALKELKPLVDTGDVGATNTLAVMYAHGRGVPKDTTKAISLYRVAAEAGNVDAQFNLATMYSSGTGVAKNLETAAVWFSKAAVGGDATSQRMLGVMYFDGMGVGKDGAIAAKWFRQGADGGDTAAQRRLGEMYAYGDGIEKDEAAGAAQLSKAAAGGDAIAQFEYGWMLANGLGVAKDQAASIAWWRKAADQGNARARFGMGTLYEFGTGVEKDAKEAAQWYRLAVDQGHATAQNNLGTLYERGLGVRQDPLEAARLYELSARQGDGDAQRNLARLYRDGVGVRADAVVAYAWLNLAASADEPNTHALAEREQIAARLSREQVVEGQRLSREWKPGQALGTSKLKPVLVAGLAPPTMQLTQASFTGRFPARPEGQQGVTTCNTRCENSTCYRTYDSGKQVEYQARQKWNPVTNRFDWDAGTC